VTAEPPSVRGELKDLKGGGWGGSINKIFKREFGLYKFSLQFNSITRKDRKGSRRNCPGYGQVGGDQLRCWDQHGNDGASNQKNPKGEEGREERENEIMRSVLKCLGRAFGT